MSPYGTAGAVATASTPKPSVSSIWRRGSAAHCSWSKIHAEAFSRSNATTAAPVLSAAPPHPIVSTAGTDAISSRAAAKKWRSANVSRSEGIGATACTGAAGAGAGAAGGVRRRLLLGIARLR